MGTATLEIASGERWADDVGRAVTALERHGTGWGAGRLSYAHVTRLRYRILAERFGRRFRDDERALAAVHFESLNQLGIFPADPDFYDEFDRVWTDDLRSLDYVAVVTEQRLEPSRQIVTYFDVPGTLVDHLDQEPDRSIPNRIERCFLPHLAGRRLLLVAPFADLLTGRADQATFEAVWAKTGKPWFHPASVDAVTFPYGVARSTQQRYGNVLELLEEICADIDELDYDVALIAAAGLSVPIAAHVKRHGKVAIEVGGHLQIVFGVLGQRWRTPSWYERYVTDAWIDMPSQYRPEETDVCDFGAYW